MEEANLVNLPGELAEKILQFLPSYDLLTLRYVNKTTKFWVENFTTTKDFQHYKLKIDGSDLRNFGSVVDLHLPLTNFYIRNSDMSVYNDAHIPEFLAAYGCSIRKLRVQHFGTFYSDKEYNFMAALVNLEELELEEIDAVGRCAATAPKLPLPRFPENFQKLKVLKPGKITAEEFHGNNFHKLLLFACPDLQYFQYPYVLHQFPGIANQNNLFRDLQKYIQEQCDRGNGSPRLKSIDMMPLLDNDSKDEELQYQLRDFMFFIEFLGTRNLEVGIHNLPATYIDLVVSFGDGGVFPRNIEWFNCVRSLSGMIPALRLLPLLKLKEITIPNLSEARVAPGWDLIDNWPSLKAIKINFDSNVVNVMDEAFRVLEFLLYDLDRNRDSVTDLELSFEDTNQRVAKLVKPRSITENVPNIRTLKLVNWNPVNRAFVYLWRNMDFIEELYLADCESLGNVGFVGECLGDPAFLKLTRLKTLTLKLDGMPKITDLFFKEVLSQMKLEELVLISEAPLTKITADGIRALAQGKFGSSIKRFPFDSWKLANTSDKELQDLKKLFPGR